MSWQIDKTHSSITFSVRHMMISKVRGRFTAFDGTFDINEANPGQSKVAVTIQTSSINTNEAQRDGHLQSPDFFDVAQYPTISFNSTNIQFVNDEHFKVTGDLTIKGVAKTVVLDVDYAGQAKSPWGTTNAGFTATTKINRKDWGLTYNQVLETGGVLVGDNINITIELELVKQVEGEAVPA